MMKKIIKARKRNIETKLQIMLCLGSKLNSQYRDLT
jgi:hypothetical protein